MDSDQTEKDKVFHKDHPVVAAARKEWPPVFALSHIGELSGKVFTYSTIRNKKALNLIPEDCFARSGAKKVVVHRDTFLDWWNTQVGPCKIEK